ncbi:Uncharacterised protein [Chlamydia trachomatis]|nr:Uncharacterised protein [Chlamydia trachomatis]CRH49088.1 Uncharacterised protein [Chlamydia trachomatis]
MISAGNTDKEGAKHPFTNTQVADLSSGEMAPISHPPTQ